MRLFRDFPTYELQTRGGQRFYTITPNLPTRLFSNRLAGEAFEAIGVLPDHDVSDEFPGDSTWTWTGDGQARIDVAVILANCFEGMCGTHYFQVDVSSAGATVRDKGGFIPAAGLDLAPGTIRLPN